MSSNSIGGAPVQGSSSPPVLDKATQSSDHANIGGHTASTVGRKESERESVTGQGALKQTETLDTTPTKTSLASRLGSLFKMKPGALSVSERVAQFGRKLLRSKEERKIHHQTKNHLHNILDESVRVKLKEKLDKAQGMEEGKAAVELEDLHRQIDAEVKAQSHAAAVIPSTERFAVKHRLAELYLEQAVLKKDEQLSPEKQQELTDLENIGSPALPKREDGGDNPQVVEKKLFQALALQEQMKLRGALYKKKLAEFNKLEDTQSPTKKFKFEEKISEFRKADDRVGADNLKGVRHPRDMTKDEIIKFSSTIDAELDKIVGSEAFQEKITTRMKQLGQAEDFYATAKKMIDDINRGTVKEGKFLADAKPTAKSKSSLIDLLFPKRSINEDKQARDEASNTRLALAKLPILPFLSSPSYSTREGLPDKDLGGTIFFEEVCNRRPPAKLLGKVESFNTEVLEKTIKAEKEQLKELKSQSPTEKEAVKSLQTAIHKANFSIASNELQLMMQKKMQDINKRYNLDKSIDKKTAKKELRELHETVLKGYDAVRNEYSDAQPLQIIESAYLLASLTNGVHHPNPIDFHPTTFASSEIREELMTQMRESMGFSEKDEMIDRLVDDYQGGAIQKQDELKHQISDLKAQWKDDLPDQQKRAIKSELYPLMMKLDLYEKVSVIEGTSSSERKEAIENLQWRLKKQREFFEKSVPNSTNYGDVAKLANLDATEFANIIEQFAGRL